MNLEQITALYASVLRQLLPVGGYDPSPSTEALSVDVYAHAKLFAQADLDAKRILSVLEAIPQELINEYELEYGLPLKCTVNASRTIEERLQILNWIRTSRNVLNRTYLEQILSIFGVVLIDIVKFKPLLCTAACDSPVNTEQLRYKVFLRLQYPMNADMNCIVENYLPGYLRIEWMIDMPWGNWILNPSVTVNTNVIAHYTAYKTNQREYYDSYANLDLTQAVVHSLHNSDMQQWQAVKDAVNQLTGVTSVFDPTNNQIVYTETPPSDGTSNPNYQYRCQSKAANGKIFNTVTECGLTFTKQDFVNEIINVSGCTIQDNKGICTFKIDYGSFTGDSAYYIATIVARVEALPEEEQKTLTLQVVAQKVISNISSSNQAISLLAEAYLEAVANSIFNTESSKQFVKLSDLLSQFELNKTLRI